MADADRHKERSQKIADTLRALLTTLATAGIAAAYTLNQTASRLLWLLAAGAFVVSLACIVVSWFSAKNRALQRYKAALEGKPEPPFTHRGRDGWKSSWRWDKLAAAILIVGATLLVFALYGFDYVWSYELECRANDGSFIDVIRLNPLTDSAAILSDSPQRSSGTLSSTDARYEIVFPKTMDLGTVRYTINRYTADGIRVFGDMPNTFDDRLTQVTCKRFGPRGI